MEKLFRVDYRCVADWDSILESVTGMRVVIEVTEYPIIKTTTCGAWIYAYGKKKFVNLQRKKKFACATVEDAYESFIYRKQRQIEILKKSLENAEMALSIATHRNNNKLF